MNPFWNNIIWPWHSNCFKKGIVIFSLDLIESSGKVSEKWLVFGEGIPIPNCYCSSLGN